MGRRRGDPRPTTAAGASLGAAAVHPHPFALGSQDRAGVSESAFLAQPDLTQKGELVQTERIIRLAKAANISSGPKLLPGREFLGLSVAGPSGPAESPLFPHSSFFPQKRGQEGLGEKGLTEGRVLPPAPQALLGVQGQSGILLEAQMLGAFWQK